MRPEWGDPTDSQMQQSIVSYDPYINLRRAKLPHVLLQTGNNDALVPYWGPLKFAAKLREMRKDERIFPPM